eukprot:scaffold99574_cov57-Phaeocystis_antarctica.AAC.1
MTDLRESESPAVPGGGAAGGAWLLDVSEKVCEAPHGVGHLYGRARMSCLWGRGVPEAARSVDRRADSQRGTQCLALRVSGPLDAGDHRRRRRRTTEGRSVPVCPPAKPFKAVAGCLGIVKGSCSDCNYRSAWHANLGLGLGRGPDRAMLRWCAAGAQPVAADTSCTLPASARRVWIECCPSLSACSLGAWKRTPRQRCRSSRRR